MNVDQVGSSTGMTDVLARNWWMIALRGVAALVFAAIVFSWRGITLQQFVDVFGLFAVLNGGLALTAAFTAPAGAPRFGVLMGTGAINIVAGLIALAAPGLTLMTARVLIAFWGCTSGFAEIGCGRRLRQHGWWLIGAGTISLILLVLLISWPGPAFVTLVHYLGWWAILFGVLLLAQSMQLRTHDAEATSASPA